MYYDERGNYFDYTSDESNISYQNLEDKTLNYFDEINYSDIDKKSFTNNENYMIEDNDKNINNVNFDITNYNFNNYRPSTKFDVTNISNGFNRGNMFNNLYDPYKKYNFKVMVKGEKDNLLLKIQMLDFALNDLNLYLDLNPNDKDAINLFNKYNEEKKSTKKIFENKYGPLTYTSYKYNNEFIWIKNPWPWDKGGSI